MMWALILLQFVTAAIQPLPNSLHDSLQRLQDNGRIIDEPLLPQMLDHVAVWTSGIDDTPVRLQVNHQALLNDPATFRGELYRFVGVIQQVTTLRTCDIAVVEWFLRIDSGQPLVVYLPPDRTPELNDGHRVVVVARFLKVIEETARDKKVRRYPAFVGRHVAVAPYPTTDFNKLLAVALPVGVLLLVFSALFLHVRRRRGMATPLPAHHGMDHLDESTDLPDDPAEALTELRRRAGS